MKPLYVIFGILSFAVGVLCMMNPFSSFMAIGIFVAVFLMLVGLLFIMVYFMGRKDRYVSPNKPSIGFAGVFFGIAMIVIAVLSLISPTMQEILDMIILIVVAAWMIMSGFFSIYTASALKKQDRPGQTMAIVFGILMIILGIYGLFHMVIFGQALGLVLGFELVLFGFYLIFSAFIDPDVGDLYE